MQMHFNEMLKVFEERKRKNQLRMAQIYGNFHFIIRIHQKNYIFKIYVLFYIFIIYKVYFSVNLLNERDELV